MENGQAGTIYTSEIEDLEPQKLMHKSIDFSKDRDWDGQRMAPIGASTKMSVHPYVGVFLHKVLSVFNRDQSTMASMFLIPVIICSLAVIPAFFIGRKLAGDVGGFFAGAMLALNANFLGRTAAGFSDTDSYNVLFPLLVTWFFIESITQKSIKKRIVFASLSGVCVGLFALAWQGWWFIFNFMLAGIGFYIVYLLIKYFYLKKDISNILKEKELQNYALSTFIFIIISAISTTIFYDFTKFLEFLKGPFGFMAIKEVAVTSLWPTIRTTVAELNPASFSTVVNSTGGNIFFLIAILGIILNFVMKRKNREANIKIGILLTLWFVGTIYASTKGVRFILLLIPAFSLAFGTSMGIIYSKASQWISKSLKIDANISKATIAILLLLLLIQPLRGAALTAKHEIPSMNDAWYNTLTKIKTNTSEDSIINSWWDFGHWFITLGDRRVTFDGAGQDQYMAHWVGKSLLADDEKKTAAILRMVDCGNNNAFWALDEALNDTVLEIDILNEIIMLERGAAKIKLLEYVSEEKAEEVLRYSHCTPPDNYYITSDDMVGKSGVWAHFGSWNFNRASMYQSVKKLNAEKGTELLKNKFNLDEDALPIGAAVLARAVMDYLS